MCAYIKTISLLKSERAEVWVNTLQGDSPEVTTKKSQMENTKQRP